MIHAWALYKYSSFPLLYCCLVELNRLFWSFFLYCWHLGAQSKNSAFYTSYQHVPVLPSGASDSVMIPQGYAFNPLWYLGRYLGSVGSYLGIPLWFRIEMFGICRGSARDFLVADEWSCRQMVNRLQLSVNSRQIDVHLMVLVLRVRKLFMVALWFYLSSFFLFFLA